MKEIEKLESFPPGSNPFHHDHFRMGSQIDESHMAMFTEFEENEELILVHIPSGKRVRLNLKEIFK